MIDINIYKLHKVFEYTIHNILCKNYTKKYINNVHCELLFPGNV